MKDLHLQQFTANSFLKIDKESPVIIDFSKYKKGQNVITLSGDMKTGKTSTLTALMVMMGATLNFDPKDFINRKDETADVELKFSFDGSDYIASLSGNRMGLKKFYKDAGKDGKWIAESSPRETLRTIFGALAVSPLFLKELPGKKQIQWLKEYMGTDEDVSKKEQKKITELQAVIDERKETNREIKSLKGWLDQSELYSNYEKSQAKYGTPINAEKEKKKFDDLATKKNAYDQYKNTVAVTEASLSGMDRQILELEESLKKLRNDREGAANSLETGQKWLEEKKSVLKEYEDANSAWLNLSKDMTAQATWKEVLKKEKDYNEALEKNINQESDVERLRKELLKLTQSYIPKSAEGLEVRVKVNLNDEDEGLYYNGLTQAQLSESEAWELWLPVFVEKGSQFMFCENVTSLGSDAVATVNKLTKAGCTFFGSEMDRAKDCLQISVSTKLI